MTTDLECCGWTQLWISKTKGAELRFWRSRLKAASSRSTPKASRLEGGFEQLDVFYPGFADAFDDEIELNVVGFLSALEEKRDFVAGPIRGGYDGLVQAFREELAHARDSAPHFQKSPSLQTLRLDPRLEGEHALFGFDVGQLKQRDGLLLA